ncbi:cation:proton antiporter [Wenxinia saemankumensis]|uniref:Kef-type potassium/proton antiporter, CPA2 family n=1 Tax=Wenxinia saemankumensis TaxID=1447782 RepID=A0A1M6DRS0_9RHOB|nr:cation:proton antiporter [Wenxinia saemankumensis]SHI75922.1 Kef-type potassium/proton antiporter, CPA2 family [Wenxinia saemankumensis]
MTTTLLLAFLFLVAGLIAVPLATRLGLGSVLGFLLAGIVLSPLLAALNVDVVQIQHFAEFGVVMMLFLVGLELEPKRLWGMRMQLLGLGGLQVAGTAALVMAAGTALGLGWSLALAAGLILALSSTAIVLQTLTEKGLLKSDGGQSTFSVLLTQDIAVIPMLALLPLLAMPELMHGAAEAVQHGTVSPEAGIAAGAMPAEAAGDHGPGMSLVEGLPGWGAALVTLGAVAAVGAGGYYLTEPLFRHVARAQMRELFIAAALGLVVGIALLMSLVGLSPALGTFLAGVVLATSPYKHELEADIDPFRGLLLGLFFMTVGAGIDFALLAEGWLSILGLTLGLMALKAVWLFVIATLFGLRDGDRALFSLGLAQAGEFGFVLISFAVANAVLPGALADRLLLVVALSMLATPGLFILYERVLAPRLAARSRRAPDRIEDPESIVILGHGRFGGIVNRMLRLNGYKTTVVDYSASQLDMLRTFGVPVWFGDATRPDILEAARVGEARLVVVALDNPDSTMRVVEYMGKHHPEVHVIARARNRHHTYELWAAGCRDIVRETYDSSIRAGRSAFEALGHDHRRATLMARAFEASDRRSMVELASLYDPNIPSERNAPYVAKVRENMTQIERDLKGADPEDVLAEETASDDLREQRQLG